MIWETPIFTASTSLALSPANRAASSAAMKKLPMGGHELVLRGWIRQRTRHPVP
ncbi:hypothetical protein [Arthrobacter sp. STN4]|uniref:hypothetical protein n=1 Tax=Arthrobacter sp. STN4 TaxID=2923276 RepID=UPI0035BFFD37